MARIGGKRAVAGRPRAAKNKRTLAQEAARANGELPLDYMLRVMRNDEASENIRAEMAKAAAPFIHSRLTAVEHTGEDAGSFIVIVRGTDAEL